MAVDHLDEWSVSEETSSSFLSLPPSRSPSEHPELWERVEEATKEIIEYVHPTVVSENRRRNVIDYIQRLIKMTLGCEVHAFGSVPLKTYLPDGDIDLTVFGGLCHEEELARKVGHVLEREEHNGAAPFVVKDVQLIRAEVKLIKCLVQNIVVDISFNQLGGICTLCFLEKIDHLIGKDHLFKRSVILIKTWCYYESRILGAFHGLVSTYALETLVLYIFHLFHSSLNDPLAVLYKFLDYFSKFDWYKYSVNLSDPVFPSSQPKLVENGGQELLLTSEFLKECLEMYSVPPTRGLEANSGLFQKKFLNIVDPLKENNNLGRSVNKGNFYRIKYAFTYGARKLGRILLKSEEDNVNLELRKFFSNMLHRHGSGQRPDVLDDVPFVRYDMYNAIPPANQFQEGHESESSNSSVAAVNGKDNHEDSLYGRVSLSSTSEERLGEDLASLRIQKVEISDDVITPFHEMSNGVENHWVDLSTRVEDLHTNENEQVTWPHVEELPLNHNVNGGTPNLLSDLTGDYESQLQSLRYGRWWFDYVQSGIIMPPLSPHPAMPFPPVNANGVVPGPGSGPGQVFFHMNHQMIPNANFCIGDLPKPRGTGTYFPIARHYRERPFSSPRGRNSNQSRSPRYNGRNMDRQQHHHNHHSNQANGSCDIMTQTDSLESSSETNEKTQEPLPVEQPSPPEGDNQSESNDNGSEQPKSLQEEREYKLGDDEEFPPL